MHTRSLPAIFVGMDSNNPIFRVFILNLNKIHRIRADDFRPNSKEELPGMSVVLDGLAREAEEESKAAKDSDDMNDCAAHLISALNTEWRKHNLHERSTQVQQRQEIRVPT